MKQAINITMGHSDSELFSREMQMFILQCECLLMLILNLLPRVNQSFHFLKYHECIISIHEVYHFIHCNMHSLHCP